MKKQSDNHPNQVVLQGDSEVIEKIAKNDYFTLTYENKVFRVQRESHNEDQRNAIIWMVLPTIIQLLIYLLTFDYFDLKLISISGKQSISQITIILGLVGVISVFSAAFFLGKRKELNYVKNVPVRHYPALLVSICAILLMTLLFFFYLFDLLFMGLKLDKYLSSLLILIILSTVNYLVLYFTFTMSSTRLTKLMSRIMIGGSIIAVITNSDTRWWERHLSYLGSSEATKSWPFNVTLILSGLLMTSLVDSIFISLEKQYQDYPGIRQLRYLLYLTGISLAIVGIFPFDGPRLQPMLHNRFAELLVILVLIMMFGNQWFLPRVNRSFAISSYGIGLFLAIFGLVYLKGGYISLTGFEIISFLVSFVWLLMMFDYLDYLLHPHSLELNLSLELKNSENEL